MRKQPDLSIVVPVHNAADSATQLIESFRQIDATCEVILVDDCSDDGSGARLDDLAESDDVTVVHHPRNLGAGVARNTGFALATGRYTLFFDDDDIFHPAGADRAIDRLDRTGADVAMTTYRFRRDAELREPMNDPDVKMWKQVMGDSSERTVTLDKASQLLKFTNYPWNKVLRTSTYHDARLEFGKGPVNNDVLGHWWILLRAGEIVLIDEPICTHVVQQSGRNLTNRVDGGRLALFDALNETLDLLESTPHLRRRYAHHYWSFALNLAAWGRARVAARLHPEYDEQLARLVFRVDLSDYARIRTELDPSLADQIRQEALA